MISTILVTGANGFVGSHIVEALQQRNDIKLIAACRDKRTLAASFVGEVREGDLRDETYLSTLLAGVDVVCHAASWTSLWSHESESHQLLLEPSIAFIHAAHAAGVKRFIYASTTSASAPEQSSNPMSRGVSRAF